MIDPQSGVDITEDDWIFGEILSNPVLFREFLNTDDPNWTPLEMHERAWTTCTKHFISMCCGRSVHKTTSMIEMLYWWMINSMFISGDQGLFVLVPNKAQKDITFNRIRAACEKHWLIRYFVKPGAINITEGRIDFLNGFQFLMRLAGEAGKETNVIGIHTYRIWVDEAQDLQWRTWQSLQNCLKEELPGHQMIVSGVPNGGRQENVLYHCDQVDERYVKYNIAQTMMSWWTPEMEVARRIFYRAVQEDSEDYKHFVLGQHGAPTFTVFDRNRFNKAPYPTIKEVYTQNTFDRVKRTNSKGDTVFAVEDVVLCPPMPLGDYGLRPPIGIGYDPGFSPDPAVFLIMYQDLKTAEWKFLVRYELQRVEYAIQREVFNWLDKVYEFDFLGIDMGGIGKVQYQDLTGELNIYKDRKFAERLYPVEFGGRILVAIDDDGVEKTDLVKRVAVEMLSRWVYERRIAFSDTDDDLMSELERTKFTRTITGEPVYRTEDDHQMSALMCALMAYENKYGVPVSKPTPQIRLLAARWLDIDREIGVSGR